jgi:hypothetical protein
MCDSCESIVSWRVGRRSGWLVWVVIPIALAKWGGRSHVVGVHDGLARIARLFSDCFVSNFRSQWKGLNIVKETNDAKISGPVAN